MSYYRDSEASISANLSPRTLYNMALNCIYKIDTVEYVGIYKIVQVVYYFKQLPE